MCNVCTNGYGYNTVTTSNGCRRGCNRNNNGCCWLWNLLFGNCCCQNACQCGCNNNNSQTDNSTNGNAGAGYGCVTVCGNITNVTARSGNRCGYGYNGGWNTAQTANGGYNGGWNTAQTANGGYTRGGCGCNGYYGY